MNKEQKIFIRKKLIPFIKREQGRGFGMSHWLRKLIPETVDTEIDDIERKIPVCGTVACIGGSIACLMADPFRPAHELTERELSKRIGLDFDYGHGLFYRWDALRDPRSFMPQWPQKFADLYKKAKTPRAKASIACKLLEEVARTGGKCLAPVRK